MMAEARPFAYNPSLFPISGTTQLSDLIYGTPLSGFTSTPQFWNGPDEDLKYIIGYQNAAGNQPNPVGIPAYVQFWGCQKTDSDFINLSEYISRKNGTPQVFATANDAKIWLNLNGYWTSFDQITPTPTATLTSTPTETNLPPTPTPTETNLPPTPTPTPTNTETQTPTPTPTPTNTETQTPTPTNTETQTPTPTPTVTETPAQTPTTTQTPTQTAIPKFTVINNSTLDRTVTQINGLGPWTLTTGSYPVGAGETAYGLTHPALVNAGLDQLVIQFGGSLAIDISITKNGSPYTASSSPAPFNVTASQINYFVDNPSDFIQANDVIVITITDTI